MVRRGGNSATRQRSLQSGRQRWLAGAGLLVLLIGGAAWWEARTWMPSRDDYPVQGAWLDAGDLPVNFHMLKQAGADFVYLTDGSGGSQRDPGFAESLAAAREQKLQVGAVHVYDPCSPADAQAANFVTTVPRDGKLLPPAIALDIDDKACRAPPDAAALDSELTTFLNQIERHTGKPAMLLLSRAFENRYHLAVRIDRNLWLEGAFLSPYYAGRPWVMWTASDRLRTAAASHALRWVVVRP